MGGAKDGKIDHASFRIDLTQLNHLFTTINRFEWYSVAESDQRLAFADIRSLISVYGIVGDGNEVRLELLAIPPENVKPGLHHRPDGMIYETH